MQGLVEQPGMSVRLLSHTHTCGWLGRDCHSPFSPIYLDSQHNKEQPQILGCCLCCSNLPSKQYRSFCAWLLSMCQGVRPGEE